MYLYILLLDSVYLKFLRYTINMFPYRPLAWTFSKSSHVHGHLGTLESER